MLNPKTICTVYSTYYYSLILHLLSIGNVRGRGVRVVDLEALAPYRCERGALDFFM